MSNTYTTVNSKISAPINYTYTNTLGAIGSSGQLLTTAGGNGTSWVTASASNNPPTLKVADGVMTVTGEPASLEVKGKVVINGQDLEERLKTIEKVLMIPERDVILEAKYPSLKKKFDEYINALEKYKTFERIKGTYD